jgi:hypothetical protein
MTLTPKDGKLGSFEFAYQGGFQFHYTLTGAPHLHHKKK